MQKKVISSPLFSSGDEKSDIAHSLSAHNLTHTLYIFISEKDVWSSRELYMIEKAGRL